MAQKGLYEVIFELNFETCKFVSQETGSMCKGMEVWNNMMHLGNYKQLCIDGLNGKMKWQERRVGTRS